MVGVRLQQSSRMDLRGKPEIERRVGVYGYPTRYQGDVYVSIQFERTIIRQVGWYRRSRSFCPCYGIKAFFN